MSTQNAVFHSFSLAGTQLDRVRQALEVAEHQVRLAQSGSEGLRVEDALIDLEETIREMRARLASALDDDQAEAKECAATDLDRTSWFPRYRAA